MSEKSEKKEEMNKIPQPKTRTIPFVNLNAKKNTPIDSKSQNPNQHRITPSKEYQNDAECAIKTKNPKPPGN